MLARPDLNKLREAGYVVCDGVDDNMPTLEFAREIGTVLNLHSINSAYPNRVVDILRPQEKCALSLNRYHGNYGFREYPAHTDLAHWLVPPRFLLLRGRGGARYVNTHIYDAQTLSEILPRVMVKRALFFSRNARMTTALGMEIERTKDLTLRWDPLFIRPANSHAKTCAEILNSSAFKDRKLDIKLGNELILIIDNWRALHGRGSVPLIDQSRQVERTYLEKINGIPS